MIEKKRKVLFGICSFAFAASAVCGLTAAKTVSANDEPVATSYFEMTGAGVRFDDPTGIRFEAKMSEVEATSTYHMMIVPYTWITALGEVSDYYAALEGKGLTAWDGKGEQPAKAFAVLDCEPNEKALPDNGVEYLLRGSITTVQYANSNTQFFGVAFEQDAEGNRTYATNQEAGVRSCAYVAGELLNQGAYADDVAKTELLNGMVNKAYNKVLNNAEDAATEEFDFSLAAEANAEYTSVELTLDYDAQLDLPIAWTCSAPATFDETTKVLTFNQTEGVVTVSAKVAGITKTLEVECGKEVLNSFTGSATHIAPQTLNGTTAGEYVASYTDGSDVVKEGVGKATVPTSGSQSVGVRFNKTKAELVEIFNSFKGLTFTMLVSDADVEGDIETTFFSQGNTSVKKTIAQNTWTDVYLTKAELFKYAKAKGKTEAEIVEAFAEAFCKEGLGRFNIDGWTRAISFTGDVGEDSTVVYIDKITYKLPFVEAANVLNGFTEKAELGVAGLTTAGNITGTWLENYTANGTTKYGVGQVSTTNSNLNFRFNKTAAELEAIFAEFDSLKFTICVVSGDETTETLKFFNSFNKTIDTNKWVTVELTKSEIYNACKGGIKAVAADEFSTDDNIWSVLATILCDEGAGQYMFKNSSGNGEWTRVMKFATASTSATVYFDEISYELPFVEAANVLNSFTKDATLIDKGANLTSTNYVGGTWLENYQGKDGVAKISTTQNISFRFNKTKEELTTIFTNLDTLKFTVYVASDSAETVEFKLFGNVTRQINTNEWVTIEVSKAAIINGLKGGVKVAIGDTNQTTEEGIVDVLATVFSSTGNGLYLLNGSWSRPMAFSTAQASELDVYFDEISFTSTSAS